MLEVISVECLVILNRLQQLEGAAIRHQRNSRRAKRGKALIDCRNSCRQP